MVWEGRFLQHAYICQGSREGVSSDTVFVVHCIERVWSRCLDLVCLGIEEIDSTKYCV